MHNYDSESEIERMLKLEIQDQKRTGNGIHGRALRLRKHETVKTPSESLKGIERLKIYAPSVIHSTTIGEMKMNELLEKIKSGEIPPKSEFEALDFENSQKALAELRRLHTNHDIVKQWKCSSVSLNSYFLTMQVAKSKKGNNVFIGQSAIDYLNNERIAKGFPKINEQDDHKKRAYNRHVNVSQSDDNKKSNVNEVNDKIFTSTPHVQPVKEVEVNNALINIKRKFKTLELENFLQRLSMFLSEDNQEYLVEIKVTEVERNE